MLKETLTPTEQRIFDILVDGRPHFEGELAKQMYSNGDGVSTTLARHISNIRGKLSPGVTVARGNLEGKTFYCLARPISSDN